MQVNDFDEIIIDESCNECNLECEKCNAFKCYRLCDINLINQTQINDELFKHNHHRTSNKNGKNRTAEESKNVLL
jgi:hypothetical protein